MTPELDRPFEWLARFVADMPVAVALFDLGCRYVAASDGWIAIFGPPPDSFRGRRHDQVYTLARETIEQTQSRVLAGARVDDWRVAADPSTRHSGPIVLSASACRDPNGTIAGVIVTARRDHAPAALAAPSTSDLLTGLADRQEFARRLREILADPLPQRRAAVIFALNLDGFRNLNKLYGSAIGDQALKIVGERLSASIRQSAGQSGDGTRDSDLVARLGGDEFGVICAPPALSAEEADAFAVRLAQTVQTPIAIGAQSLRLTASVGILVTAPAHREPDETLRDLDLALRQAKALGPGSIIAWQSALTEAATRRSSVAEQLRRAFDNGELLLHYQPVLWLGDGRMVGAEALLRWNHPSDGLVAPAMFLPALEETGLIVEVGAWVIREVARQIESWRLLYGRDVADWVSVNLSGHQFDDPTPLLASLYGMRQAGFSVRRLKVEVTEAALRRSPEIAATVLAELDGLGVRVAIDDFGSGRTTLTTLRQHTIDTIKIDAELVAQIGNSEGDRRVRSAVENARKLNTLLIAEGVETLAQRDFLTACGCEFGQGHLFAAPMDGALLGAYALTHAADPTAAPVRLPPPAGRSVA